MIIAEVAPDTTRFPTRARLASCARFAPGVSESAGRKKGNAGTRHGNRYLARVLGEAAVGASGTNTFFGERFRRIARRRGTKRAIRQRRSILMIVRHLLTDPDAPFGDVGPGYYDSRLNLNRQMRTNVREVRNLGCKVTLQPAA